MSNPNTQLFAADLPPTGKTLQRKRRVTPGCHRMRNCCLLRNMQQYLEAAGKSMRCLWKTLSLLCRRGLIAAVRILSCPPDTTPTQAQPHLSCSDLPLPFSSLLPPSLPNPSATPVGIWWEEHRCHSRLQAVSAFPEHTAMLLLCLEGHIRAQEHFLLLGAFPAFFRPGLNQEGG